MLPRYKQLEWIQGTPGAELNLGINLVNVPKAEIVAVEEDHFAPYFENTQNKTSSGGLSIAPGAGRFGRISNTSRSSFGINLVNFPASQGDSYKQIIKNMWNALIGPWYYTRSDSQGHQVGDYWGTNFAGFQFVQIYAGTNYLDCTTSPATITESTTSITLYLAGTNIGTISKINTDDIYINITIPLQYIVSFRVKHYVHQFNSGDNTWSHQIMTPSLSGREGWYDLYYKTQYSFRMNDNSTSSPANVSNIAPGSVEFGVSLFDISGDPSIKTLYEEDGKIIDQNRVLYGNINYLTGAVTIDLSESGYYAISIQTHDSGTCVRHMEAVSNFYVGYYLPNFGGYINFSEYQYKYTWMPTNSEVLRNNSDTYTLASASAPVSSVPLVLFGHRVWGGNTISGPFYDIGESELSDKVKSIVIYDSSDAVVHNFVPAYDMQGLVFGLYDTVTDIFYGNEYIVGDVSKIIITCYKKYIKTSDGLLPVYTISTNTSNGLVSARTVYINKEVI